MIGKKKFKNKKDFYNFTNYGGHKFMNHIIQLWERIIKYILKKIISY